MNTLTLATDTNMAAIDIYGSSYATGEGTVQIYKDTTFLGNINVAANVTVGGSSLDTKINSGITTALGSYYNQNTN